MSKQQPTHTAIIFIESGRIVESTRESLAKAIRNLPDGQYEVAFHPMRAFRPGRYKYYWSYLLRTIMQFERPMVTVRNTGETRPASVQEFHDFLKVKMNGVEIIDPDTGECVRVGLSTTELDDGEFISRYEEEIAAFFIDRHTNMELLSRSEWADKWKSVHDTLKELRQSKSK